MKTDKLFQSPCQISPNKELSSITLDECIHLIRAHLDNRFLVEISPDKCQVLNCLQCNLPALFTGKVERLNENKELITQKGKYVKFCGPKK